MDKEYKLDLNSDAICRNCLAQNCQLKSLFRCEIIDGEILQIPTVYKSVTNISIAKNDSFPQNICTKCESVLFEAFIFKQKSFKSHKLLGKILNISQEERSEDEIPLEFVETTDPETLQTQEIDEDESFTETKEDDTAKDTKNYPAEFIDESNESWQVVYIAETEEQSNEQDDLMTDTLSMDSLDVNCEHCGEQVPTPLLDKHSEQHANLLTQILSSLEFYRCSRCLMTFIFFEHFQEHLESIETCEPSIESDKDDIVFDNEYINNYPLLHILSICQNPESNTYACTLCNEDFTDLSSIRNHFEVSHTSSAVFSPDYLQPESTHLCSICQQSFKNLKDCLHHVYFHQTDYACTDKSCDFLATTFSELHDHLYNHKAPLDCSHCSYQAKDSEDLKNHQRTTCEARNLACDICGKTFYKKNTLNMHIRSHSSERRYACTLCPKAFLQNNDLKNHLRVHNGERPYKCDLCNKRFKTVGQKNGHMFTHNTEKNYTCDICNKSYKSARILHGHKKIHAERQFQCDVCEKKFNRKYHLTLHMKRHDK